MNRRALFAIPLAVLVACSGTDTTAPSGKQTSGPSLAISDGSHSGGNKDFFFLPPIVAPGSTFLQNFTPNGFLGSLNPIAEICLLDASSAGAVNPGTPCKTGFVPIAGGVKKFVPTGPEPSRLPSGLFDAFSFYYSNYKLPPSCVPSYPFYRIRVRVEGYPADKLGFADVQCVNNLLALWKVDFKNFGGGIRGTTLLIPFRIETCALGAVPGQSPCTFATVDPGAPEPTTVLAPTPPGAPPAGVTFPGGDTGTPPVTLTIQPCTTLGIPGEFGSCFTYNSNLGSEGLSQLATVFVCDVLDATLGLPQELRDRIHLHRKHNNDPIEVLPGAQTTLCPTSEAEGSFSVGRLMVALAHADWKSVRRQVFGLLAPKPLYARRRINLGAGGKTCCFSDFQFAEDRSIPIINYGSSLWSYQIDGTPPTDWFSSAASPFTLTGVAPFGSPNEGCTLNAAVLPTSWPASESTYLYARRTFALLAPATVRIGIAIDNDVQVYVDGVDVSDGLRVHEDCPSLDSFIFDVPLLAGSHILAIRALDRGVSSYLDAKVTFLPPSF